MKSDVIGIIKCPNCKHEGVEITQPANHSEDTPAGECKNCGAFVWLTYSHQTRVAYAHFITLEEAKNL
jgi:DNA-directed RNA polymerase subunit M/transcription elongation factor TFIIS